ncbi:MAG: SSS family solute:Na+ symporter, partial [Bacteroidia bacterium]
ENGLEGFFLGGRNMPWYLAGLSMVATTFAADTPLAVTELVAQGGVSKNWLWWNLLAGGILTTVFFARLWRKSGVLTEVEFINIRYSGKAARFLRGFKALYLGLFLNAMIIAMVNKAFMALVQVFFDVPPNQLLLVTGVAMLIVVGYSAISGLKGIAVTDAVQFIIAMIGCIVLAVVVLRSEEIGGMTGLKDKLPAEMFNLFPSFETTSILKTYTVSVAAFLTYVGVLWWSSWYPGAEPGGGGYVAQRMMATKNEKHSVLATLFFQIAHYCLRPWPWIIVGLCAVVLYPNLSEADQKLGFVMAMKDHLPTGLRGLMLVAFLGAYMSTISTQINWGASYLVNDFYLPFVKKGVEDKPIRISRILSVVLAFFALIVTSFVTTITGVWEFIFQCGAGLGLVLIMRWFWHRINVWAEIVATVIPFLVYGTLLVLRHRIEIQHNQSPDGMEALAALKPDLLIYDFSFGVILSVALTSVVWIITAYTTRPTNDAVMQEFYDKVQPKGWWGKYGKPDNSTLLPLLGAWFLAVTMIYSVLFFAGKLIFLEWNEAWLFLGLAVLSFAGFMYCARKGALFKE